MLFLQGHLESNVSKYTCLCFGFSDFSGKNNCKEIIGCENLSRGLASGQSWFTCKHWSYIWCLNISFVHLFLVSITIKIIVQVLNAENHGLWGKKYNKTDTLHVGSLGCLDPPQKMPHVSHVRKLGSRPFFKMALFQALFACLPTLRKQI